LQLRPILFCNKQPEDKPYIEAFFSSYKTEEIYRREYSNYWEAKISWEAYRDWYRNDRLHQGIDYMSPVQYAQIAKKLSYWWPDLLQFDGVHHSLTGG
jgi:hypothetical protein